MSPDPQTPPAADRYGSPEWREWFVRHPGHISTGKALGHPMGCDRRCLDDAPTRPADAATEREWDIAQTTWSRVADLLDQGWEPFAAVQRTPNTYTSSTEVHIYLRRRVDYAE